ncbi:nucleoside 2-deoxyribosyltransferase [Methanolobus zinderi]|uniref:Putative 2'-deoxynucleoside 5'-phosphate N-hydrolase 1 n=1 Tax=Methanolobus zinderi TaxID=536044 RepID=A0A7D5IMD3_9EURY|nr:nucleoside 2-deoxyribosyltransferase [Methanolobus zinderi]QLC48865.1 nucleoside 2-deoxyribosyltransferase [Methanolobus zinderi]
MKIFLSGSIRGGRQMLHIYVKICSLLQEQGHEVLSSHVADPELEERESVMSEEEIFKRDMGFLEKSECLIAEVSMPSIGVGYEICSALRYGLPVLCLHTMQANVSAMILGNTSPDLVIKQYANDQELQEEIASFLSGMKEIQG